MDLPATLFIFGPEMVLVDCRLTDACVSFLPSFLPSLLTLVISPVNLD